MREWWEWCLVFQFPEIIMTMMTSHFNWVHVVQLVSTYSIFVFRASSSYVSGRAFFTIPTSSFFPRHRFSVDSIWTLFCPVNSLSNDEPTTASVGPASSSSLFRPSENENIISFGWWTISPRRSHHFSGHFLRSAAFQSPFSNHFTFGHSILVISLIKRSLRAHNHSVVHSCFHGERNTFHPVFGRLLSFLLYFY